MKTIFTFNHFTFNSTITALYRTSIYKRKVSLELFIFNNFVINLIQIIVFKIKYLQIFWKFWKQKDNYSNYSRSSLLKGKNS